MSEKQDLAILFSVLDKPVEEFTACPSFKNLEKENDIIKKIEPFGLPEVKKLICCSKILESCEWTTKYNVAREIYTQIDRMDVLKILSKYQDASQFEEDILKCVDGSILNLFLEFFDNMTLNKDSRKKEKASLKGKITKAKKKVEETESDSATIKNDEVKVRKTDDEIRLEKLEEEIAEKEQFLKCFEKHFARTRVYLLKITNLEEMDLQRQKAYAAIDEIKPSREEEFLIQFIRDGIITDEIESELRNYGFLQRLLECFDKNSYKDIAFPVLAKIYSEGAIDLESELVEKFVLNHNRMLAEYLEDQYTMDSQWINDAENRVFLEYSIKGTVSGNNDYVTWWNSIKLSGDWKYILEVASEMELGSLALISSKLMHHVYGQSMDAFMELLNAGNVQEIKLSASEFIDEFLRKEAPDQRDLVRGYIRNIEQSNRKIQRRLASKEREINRHSQELFSSLYAPLEELEELAVNLRLSDGKIDCSLVAGHVINALSSLREGLCAMGLETAEEIELWQKQSLIDYNPEKHRMTSVVENVNEKVKLQTLGYSYIDDEGNTKVRAAEVYIPAPLEDKKDSSDLKKDTNNVKENANNSYHGGNHSKGNYPKGAKSKKKRNGYLKKNKNNGHINKHTQKGKRK